MTSISAIVPVYNGARYVEGTLRSLLAQTLPPDEIIVVDDGSTDASVSVVESVTSEVPIILVQQPNAGQSAARNAAAQKASGELLAFVDQDDLWHRRHLEVLVPAFDDPEVGWSYSDFDEIDRAGAVVTRGFLRARNIEHPFLALNDFLRQDLMILPSASVIRASAFEQVGGFDPALIGYEDDDLFIRLFRAGWAPSYSPESLTRFRVHVSSSTGNLTFQRSRVRFLDNLVQSVPNAPRLNRFYIRDLVFPRLFRATLIDYTMACSMGDFERARAIAEILVELDQRMPGGRRRQVELALLQRPETFSKLVRAHGRIPKLLRPEINPALVPGRARPRLLR